MFPDIPNNVAMDKIIEETKQIIETIEEEYKNEQDVKVKEDIYRKMLQVAFTAQLKFDDAKDDEWWEKWSAEYFKQFHDATPLDELISNHFENLKFKTKTRWDREAGVVAERLRKEDKKLWN